MAWTFLESTEGFLNLLYWLNLCNASLPNNRRTVFTPRLLLCAIAGVLIVVASAFADPPARGGRFQREREREKAEEDAQAKGKNPDEPSGGGPACGKRKRR